MSNALWERFEASLARFEREVSHPGEQPHTLGRAGYLVVGMGRVGVAAYDYLAAQNEHPLGLDVDPARIDDHRQEGRRVIFGDAQDPELWSELSLDEVEGILLAIPHTEAKVRAIRLLREQGYAGPLSALTLREEDHETLIDAGATSVCVPLAEAGRELAKSAAGVR
jgi:Trk K+ transport system NAD-binding subunit